PVAGLPRPAGGGRPPAGPWRAGDVGLVDGPCGFLRAASTPLGAQKLLLDLREQQSDTGEKADDATILTVVPGE
ncbi:hypothetical protein, partial [Arthrobacter sp. 7Tela_A1]|uniref:hypothetical protein n=1 Tax=Arthrobacter sp. 7Tela_A1 TaxID=3093745 RepID=UPI003BB62B3A